jgi:hypothetical protein
MNETNLTIFLDESERLANAETKNATADNDNVTETKCQHVYRSSLTSCGNADWSKGFWISGVPTKIWTAAVNAARIAVNNRVRFIANLKHNAAIYRRKKQSEERLALFAARLNLPCWMNPPRVKTDIQLLQQEGYSIKKHRTIQAPIFTV